MIRVFNITAPIVTGCPSEFDLQKLLPFGMRLLRIMSSFRKEEGYLYLTVSPNICEGIDVAVLTDIDFENPLPKGTEIGVRGVYTGRWTREQTYDFPLPLSIAFIEEEL